MARIISDSYAGLQNVAQNYDRMNLDVAEQNRAAQERAYQFTAQAQLQQQKQAEEDARQASAQYMQAVQDANRTQDQQRAEANANYQFTANQKERDAATKEGIREFDIGTGLKTKELDTNAALRKQQEQDRKDRVTEVQDLHKYNEARDLIQRNLINDPKKIESDYGQLPDEYKDRLKSELAVKFQQQQNIADERNLNPPTSISEAAATAQKFNLNFKPNIIPAVTNSAWGGLSHSVTPARTNYPFSPSIANPTNAPYAGFNANVPAPVAPSADPQFRFGGASGSWTPDATAPLPDRSQTISPFTNAEQPVTNEVTRFLPNGRAAIFDANTKKFLRYAQ